MTQLTLARLAEIEAAAAKATPGPWSWDGTVWNYDSEQYAPWLVAGRQSVVTGEVHCSEENATYIALCDPATVAALCKVTRAAYNVHVLDHNAPTDDALEEVLRDAGLIEP